MRGIIIAVTSLLLVGMAVPVFSVGATASANQVDPSDVYQNDGQSGQDAADRCQDADVEVPLSTGKAADGVGTQLVPVDDEADHLRLEIPQTQEGEAVTVVVDGETPEELGTLVGYQLLVEVRDPACELVAERFVNADDKATIVFQPIQSGDHRVSTTLLSPLDHGPSPVIPPIGPPTTQSGHCSPGCMFDLETTALA